MGQKIHPIGFRLSVTKNWGSRWYANNRDFASMLGEDLRVREYLRRKLAHASVSRVLIERPSRTARITVFSARPGVVIGKKGEDIETLKSDLARMLNVPVHVNIEEIRKPETDAQLVADSIAQQLEKRIMFRRAMKRAMQNAMRLGAQGIKIMSSGRLNGAEIARTEWYREGRVPLHTLRANIDYGFGEARTTYGVIGIKVWVYKGEILGKNEQPIVNPADAADPGADKRPRRTPRDGARPAAREADAKPTAPASRAPRKRTAKPAGEEAVKPDPAAGEAASDKPVAKAPAKRVRKAAATPPADGAKE